ncbi:hypothetical protein fHeYen901_256 [Yersinia phage fHe-Yen9-01]|uniref:Uncharacterized protein n=1 Tax=Yersinia phage fHe-Yen9-01 TaxID=1965363 RepID=A0A1V0DY00_9CAUD|nr:hypothetical protein KNT60_gp255 [Yersinia phage fHe-Yen9-01]ARB06029.1 hypothetical protein fHeYen901_256 [Yersinia phage fHe-Yen9-01]
MKILTDWGGGLLFTDVHIVLEDNVNEM